MKKIYFLVPILFFFNVLSAQVISIPDINLKMKLISMNIDKNSNFEIEISEALNVPFLDLSNSNINSLRGLENFTNLEYLNCSNNPILNGIDFNVLKKLTYLNYSFIQSTTYFNIENSNLTTLVLDGSTNLKELYVTGNKNLTSLSTVGAINLTDLFCTNNKLTSINVAGLVSLKNLQCNSNQLQTLDASGLPNLKGLGCGGNLLTSLNVTGSTSITSLSCQMNKLPNLNVSGLVNLVSLLCYSNQLTGLNVNGLVKLNELYCDGNFIPSLNLAGLVSLDWLNCTNNQLTELNVSGLTNLKGIKCGYNKLSSLDLSGLTSLTNLECYYNEFKTLDLSDLKNIEQFSCYQNQLTSLLIRNGSNEGKLLDFSQNPNLEYVCADESQIDQVQQLVTKYGYTNCNVNAYCSFKPVGTYYTFQGINKVDANNNGCDILDSSAPNLKFNLSDGTNTASFISNANGNHSISFPAGTHTITPVLENPAYFNISPSNVSVTFPTQASPVNQDFCITANGVHSDLEISILQIVPGRPGFNSVFKIIYKNKGNTTQSGVVNLAFHDSVLDLITANPVVATQTTNSLSWNFTSLKPFESKEINVTFKLNAPTEVPALNIGNIVSYLATITSANTDENASDNTFTFDQTVVGSYDPNDKTCLEGSVITSNLIGEYVHYIIRFENTGTYQAENIVVKDLIDLAKFDISTLVPTSSSHSFVTKISDGNKVEFIFENINLPFDDANNDGYIAFKIKTNPTLKAGDTFTNQANIYFDYNFPILTNKATSKFETTLKTSDFEFSNYFTLYPNPVSDILNFNTKEDITIQSLAIYDILGQVVIAVPNAKSATNIDVSKLRTGNYFIKVKSDKGSSSIKFIKK
ncbi:T9SS type A sorting domain-containing protein [Flavobacterium aquidurense]|uniref:Internalin-related protein n=1 Tax=Flavobacterium aquidurense TaxID=362413 RepID=A0A0Q0X1J8_9FLAO|nr:T9SS type A sorting domain-containing protein [Flavobacterium aquidurense]KQB42261.1 Internalin-related protein [Flavobacterium aquidurense]